MGLGIDDLKKVLKLPGTWDLSYLKKWQTMDGLTWDRLMARLAAALTVFNGDLRSGYWADYFRVTTDVTAEYPIGGSGSLNRVSEHGVPDPIYGDTGGGMFPLYDYGGALGWTYMALRRARAGKLEADIREVIVKARNTFEKALLTRLFKSTYDAVGSAGKSVPFADGGTADSTYIPPSYEGATFASNHNHFLRYAADAAGRTAALKAMAATLKEHGILSPWELVVADADKALWTAQTEFKKPVRTVVLTDGVEARAVVSEETYIGIAEVDDGYFRIKPTPRVPTAYAGAFKAFGHGAADSPAVIRIEEGWPLGLALVGEFGQFPMQNAAAYFTFGAGIGNRLAGSATYFFASGSYTDPTIS